MEGHIPAEKNLLREFIDKSLNFKFSRLQSELANCEEAHCCHCNANTGLHAKHLGTRKMEASRKRAACVTEFGTKQQAISNFHVCCND